jgi:D-amino peptidase
MRVMIMTDLEGVAGVVDFSEGAPGSASYETAKELLTGETNAACDGILDAAGDADILVFDGHGPGGIVPSRIHPRVRLLHGRPIPPRVELDKGWDALFLVGHHAMNGTTDGNLNHTESHTAIVRIFLNGEEIGEIGLNTYLAGSYGVPTVFVSGDAAACREAARYVPGIEQTAVKEGINRTCAITLSPEQARRLTREKARRATTRIGDIPPAKVSGPCELVIEYMSSTDADVRGRSPGWEQIGATCVRTVGRDYQEMWSRFLA